MPIGERVVISGKINFYKGNYQITNPNYITPISDQEKITKIFPKYSLTEGLNEKNYRKLILQVLDKIENNFEWHDNAFLKNNKFNKHARENYDFDISRSFLK